MSMTTRREIFEIGSGAMHVLIAEPVPVANQLSVLLVHGFPLDHRMWLEQVEPLAQAGYRVLCPDLVGFGRSRYRENVSDNQAASMSMAQFADDLAELLERMEIAEPIAFCGLSMGGYIGWEFARRHARKLAKLIACDTRAAGDTEAIARGRRLSARTVFDSGLAPIADSMLPKLLGPRASEGVRQSVRQMILQTQAAAIAGGQLAMAVRQDATECLSGIGVPVLFIVGEEDVITPPEEMAGNRMLVADSQLVEIRDSGHLPPLEQPAAFNAAVIAFLQG